MIALAEFLRGADRYCMSIARLRWLGSIALAIVTGLTATAMPSASTKAPATVAPLRRAHAHNDYWHQRPLLDALQQGFCSVEVDIFLSEGRLLVGHDRSELRPHRTLEALYLRPLRERIVRNGGRVFPDGPRFTLLVDIKSAAEETYRQLHTVLDSYADMLTRYEDGQVREGAVSVIVSGNRPRALMASASSRLAAMDGRLDDLNTNIASSLIPLISDRWTSHFQWRGEGRIPDREWKKLCTIVAQCHQSRRRIRFWAVPHKRVVWDALWSAGVDLINTDDLTGLGAFLVAKRAAESNLPIVFQDSATLAFSIDGRPARVHTQGLYVTEDSYYVTGRLEIEPKRALLIRYDKRSPETFQHIDITAYAKGQSSEEPVRLDHPGGFDYGDGALWIPVAESRPRGRTQILRFPIRSEEDFVATRLEEAFRVADHIGAVAYDNKRGCLYGANWDTETIYVWRPDGTLMERIPREQLVRDDPAQRLAVQDWKGLGSGKVLAGGVDKDPRRPLDITPAVVSLIDIPGRERLASCRLATPADAPLPPTREGLALFGDYVFLLPGDLGTATKLYRYRLTGDGLLTPVTR